MRGELVWFTGKDTGHLIPEFQEGQELDSVGETTHLGRNTFGWVQDSGFQPWGRVKK